MTTENKQPGVKEVIAALKEATFFRMTTDSEWLRLDYVDVTSAAGDEAFITCHDENNPTGEASYIDATQIDPTTVGFMKLQEFTL